MRIVINERGLVQTDEGPSGSNEVHIDAKVTFFRDVSYSTGVVTYTQANEEAVLGLLGGPGITVYKGYESGQYIIGLQNAPSTSTVWRDVPSGALDGVNATFVLSGSPNPPESILLFRNGLAMSLGDDFSLSSRTITFLPGNEPRSGSILWARYQA